MPLAILAAGGGYKWIQLHDASSKTKDIFRQFRKKHNFPNFFGHYLSTTDNVNPTQRRSTPNVNLAKEC